MIEIYWGKPMQIFLPGEGRTRHISTIEQAHHWLQKSWPIQDRRRELALDRIDDAMACLAPVTTARAAFLSAAETAGFQPQSS